MNAHSIYVFPDINGNIVFHHSRLLIDRYTFPVYLYLKNYVGILKGKRLLSTSSKDI